VEECISPSIEAKFVCVNAATSLTPKAKVRLHMATASKKTNKPLSKNAILEAITNAVGEDLSKKQIKLVMETLVAVGHRELKKTGIFVLPGFAKFTVVKKPARPAREGINPFTKQMQKFPAKPASKGVRARAVKAVKDAVS
jgi:DNA-binding protein HU-beta